MGDKNKKGFTLVELLVVIAIIAVLATVSVVGYLGFTKKAYISNDTSLAAELNTLIKGHLTTNDDITYNDIKNIYYEEFNEDISTLEPQSARYGYHFWFNTDTKAIELKQSDELISKYSLSSNDTLRASLVNGYILLDGTGSSLANSVTSFDMVKDETSYLNINNIINLLNEDKYDSSFSYQLYELYANSSFITNNGTFRKDVLDINNVNNIFIEQDITKATNKIYLLTSDNSLKEEFISETNLVASLESDITFPETFINAELHSLYFNVGGGSINFLNEDITFEDNFSNADILYTDKLYKLNDDNNYQEFKDDQFVKDSILETIESNFSISEIKYALVDNEEVGETYVTYFTKAHNSINISLLTDKGTISGNDIIITDKNNNLYNNIFELSTGEHDLIIKTIYNDLSLKLKVLVSGLEGFDILLNGSIIYENSQENPHIYPLNDTSILDLSLNFYFTGLEFDVSNYIEYEIITGSNRVKKENDSFILTGELGEVAIKVSLKEFNLEKIIYLEITPKIEKYFDFTLNDIDKFIYRFGNNSEFKYLDYIKESSELTENNIDFNDLDIKVNFYDIQKSGDGKLINILDNPNRGFYVVKNEANNYEFIGEGLARILYSAYYNDVKVYEKELILEIIDGTNAYTYDEFVSITSKNIILMNNIEWSYNSSYPHREFINKTIYGNGFTIDASNYKVDYYTVNLIGLIKLINSSMDNIIFKGAVFPKLTYSGVGEKYNANGITLEGDSKLTNSYISGMRSPVEVLRGNILIDNTTVEGGVYANILINGSVNLILNNITTIQEIKTAIDNKTKIIGAGILFQEGLNFDNISVNLKGYLNQYNMINKDMIKGIQSLEGFINIINEAWDKLNNFKNNINGKDYVNMGIAAIAEVPSHVINNQLNNKEDYTGETINDRFIGINIKGYLYSLKKDETKNYNNLLEYNNYNSCFQNALTPSVSYNFEDERIEIDRNDINIHLSLNEEIEINFNELIKYNKYDHELPYTIEIINNKTNEKLAPISEGIYKFKPLGHNYKATISLVDNYIYDKNGNLTEAKPYQYNFNINIVRSDLPDATLDTSHINTSGQVLYGKTGVLFWVDYHLCIDFLSNLVIKDYDISTGDEIIINGADIKTKEDMINNRITIKYISGYKDMNTFKEYDGKLYFTTTIPADDKGDYNQTIEYTYTSLSGKKITATLTFIFTTSTDTVDWSN